MATTKTATYKRYNGTDWDTIYFATLASQVAESDSKFFIKKDSNTVNGKQFSKTGGITLYGSDIKWNTATAADVTVGKIGETTYALTKDTTVTAAFSTTINYLSAMETTLKNANTVLGNRIKVFEDAWGDGSGSIITTSNMGSKIEIDSDQVKVANSASSYYGNTITEALAKISNDKTALEGSIATKQDKLTFDLAPTLSSSNPVTSDGVAKKFNEVYELAAGKTKSYVIETSSTKNSEFNVLKTDTKEQLGSSYLWLTAGSFLPLGLEDTSANRVLFSSLKVGDVIFTTSAGIKDWYYGGTVKTIGESKTEVTKYAFYSIDSDSPDLSGYFLSANAKASNIAYDGQATQGLGNNVMDALDKIASDYATTSAVEGKLSALSVTDSSSTTGGFVYKVTQTNGKITASRGTWASALTAETSVPPTGKAVYNAINALSTGVDNKFSALGAAAKKGVVTSIISSNASSTDLPTVAAVLSRATKIYYADAISEVSSPIEGDICIEY